MSDEKPPYDIYERTFAFAVRVVKLVGLLNRRRDFPRSLSTQLLKAGTSVGANVEEGKGGQSRADFLSKFCFARKEAREANYWLRVLVASEYLSPDLGKPLITEVDEIIRVLTAIIKKTKGI